MIVHGYVSVHVGVCVCVCMYIWCVYVGVWSECMRIGLAMYHQIGKCLMKRTSIKLSCGLHTVLDHLPIIRPLAYVKAACALLPYVR